MGQAPKQFSAATKTFCTELEQRIAQFCAAALGPLAMLAEPGLAARVSRNVAYAPAYTIMGGTIADPAEHPRRAGARPAPMTARAGNRRSSVANRHALHTDHDLQRSRPQ